MSPVIHSLHVYPIKSCQGIVYQSAELTETGFIYDRHWMLVDKQGNFISQRQYAKLARVKTAITATSLEVSSEAVSTQLEIPLISKMSNQTNVNIWNDQCSAVCVSDEASQWFSNFLDTDCDLVYLADSEHRLVDRNFTTKNQRVGFADGFPLLVLSRASIDQLGEKLGEKIDINRFRANIIIDGCAAHEEDSWSRINVNDIDILLVKPCSRCVIPSIDQLSAEKHSSLLKMLASYRRFDGKVYVGQNGLHQSNGVISVGETVFVTEK